jgi:hypothetical protein
MIKEKGGGSGEFGTLTGTRRSSDDGLPQPLSPTHTGSYTARRELANGPSGNFDIGAVAPNSPPGTSRSMSQLERGARNDSNSRHGGWLSSYLSDSSSEDSDSDTYHPKGLASVLFHIIWFPFYLSGLCILFSAAIIEAVGGALKGLGKLLTKPGMVFGGKKKNKNRNGKQGVSI